MSFHYTVRESRLEKSLEVYFWGLPIKEYRADPSAVETLNEVKTLVQAFCKKHDYKICYGKRAMHCLYVFAKPKKLLSSLLEDLR